jgi:hypothetical protein
MVRDYFQHSDTLCSQFPLSLKTKNSDKNFNPKFIIVYLGVERAAGDMGDTAEGT